MKPFAASTTFLLLSVLAAIGQAAATTVKLSVGQSIQEAIDSLPNDRSKAVIEVESGTYNENITIARPYITFRASGSGPVVLQESVENYAVVYIDYDSSDISFYDFEIINTIGEAAGNQNAFRSYSDRIALYNCKIIGYGDTAWFSVGSVYVYNSWIEGTVDYAYGQADVYFYKSTLANNGLGSVSAPSTLDSDPKGGFVFMNANFTPVISSIYDKRQENAHSYSKPLSESEFKNSVILSRPWHNSPKNIILKSTISSHIKSAGYDAWNFSEDELESKVFYAEYENTGAGADTSQRVSWLKALTADEAAPYLSPSNFFGNLGLGTSWIDSNYLS